MSSHASSFCVKEAQSLRDAYRPRAGRGRIPRPGPTSVSGSALEPFLDTCPRDDVRAVAEAESRFDGTLLVPQGVEMLAQLLELGSECGVVALRKGVPQLRPALAHLLDLVMNLRQGHVVENAGVCALIP